MTKKQKWLFFGTLCSFLFPAILMIFRWGVPKKGTKTRVGRKIAIYFDKSICFGNGTR